MSEMEYLLSGLIDSVGRLYSLYYLMGYIEKVIGNYPNAIVAVVKTLERQ